MSTETRRPDLAQRALESGCHSSLSIGLPVHTDATIEQAKGIIMGDRHCSPEEAFRILTRLSQDTNRKLRDVALALVNRAAPRKP
jgi:hypothetical protein